MQFGQTLYDIEQAQIRRENMQQQQQQSAGSSTMTTTDETERNRTPQTRDVTVGGRTVRQCASAGSGDGHVDVAGIPVPRDDDETWAENGESFCTSNPHGNSSSSNPDGNSISFNLFSEPVSYTHLTLPPILRV